MANKTVAQIKLNQIEKIEVYVNSGHKTLAQIKTVTGADYIMNGGFFNWNWTPVPLLKVNGKMISSAPWSDYGYAWNTSDITMTTNYNSYSNFISGICLINPVRGANTTLSYKDEIGGKRGRTAMGLTNDSLVLFCTKDGSSYNMTPETVRSEMVKLGCKTAILLDGGGSSQADFLGNKVTSTRIVHNYILVYLKKNKQEAPIEPTSGNSKIKEIQTALNTKYGFNLSINGIWDSASKRAMSKSVQTEINKLYGGKLVVDGSWGPASKKACPNIKKVTQNALAWLVQACLVAKGYNLTLDSSYGPSCEKVIKEYQKAVGLGADGICGSNTFTKLLS